MLVLFESIVLGILIGIIAAILGIGGGVFLVPMLHMILGLDMHKAVGTSLFVIFFLSSSAALSYFRKRLILWKLALIFECGSTIGAFMGAHTSDILPSYWLKIFFSLVLFYTAFRMWRGARSKPKLRESQEHNRTSNTPSYNFENLSYVMTLIGLGFVAGFLSGLLGIGGGVVKVPIMKLILSIPMHNAIATSAFMIVLTSLVGSSSHFIMGNVNYLIGLTLVPSVMLGSHIGTRIAVKLRSSTISRLFAVLLAFVALRMILST